MGRPVPGRPPAEDPWEDDSERGVRGYSNEKGGGGSRRGSGYGQRSLVHAPNHEGAYDRADEQAERQEELDNAGPVNPRNRR